MTRSRTGSKDHVASDRSEETCPEDPAEPRALRPDAAAAPRVPDAAAAPRVPDAAAAPVLPGAPPAAPALPDPHPPDTTRLACVADPEDEGARADVVLGRRIAGVSRRVARELALAGRLTVDGRRAPPSHRVRAGERLELAVSAAPAVAAPGPELLVATDAFVYVVKPAGLHTHRLRPDDPPALADRVAVRFPECAAAGLDAREGGAVHRLDRGTSGVVAFARTRAAFVAAREAFAAARVGKRYMAVTTCPIDHVWPPPPDAWIAPVSPDAVEVRAPLGPGLGRDRMAVRRTGQPALTRVEPQGPPGPRRLWSLELSTGRRHQARVHLAWLGLPILGDELYGGELADRLYLHALRLDLSAAIAGELPVTAPLPPEFAAALG